MKAVAIVVIVIVVHYQLSPPANLSNLTDDITGCPGGVLSLHTSKFDWLMTHVNQMYYPMGGGTFSGRLAILVVLASLVNGAYSAQLYKKKTFSFWNYIVT